MNALGELADTAGIPLAYLPGGFLGSKPQTPLQTLPRNSPKELSVTEEDCSVVFLQQPKNFFAGSRFGFYFYGLDQ